MRAQVQRGFVGDDILVGGVVAIEAVADPTPAPGEVLIEVRACALNRLDLLQRIAPVVRGFTLPHIAGMDVAGMVVAHGDRVDEPAIGTRVLVDPVSTCGVCDRCTASLAPYCEHLRTIGSTRPGGFAELVAVPADRVHAMPEAMSFVEAATLPVAGMTAFHALHAGQHVAGETVLVNGAGSGVSCALLTLLLGRGSTVITTAGGPTKVARALEVGYHCALDHRTFAGPSDLADAVHGITGGRGVDLVVDHVGPALFRASIAALRLGGRMVFCGTTTGTEATFSLPDVYHWGRSLIGAGGYEAADVPVMMAEMASTGRAAIIDSVWCFDDLEAAQQRMASGDFFGKIVIEM